MFGLSSTQVNNMIEKFSQMKLKEVGAAIKKEIIADLNIRFMEITKENNTVVNTLQGKLVEFVRRELDAATKRIETVVLECQSIINEARAKQGTAPDTTKLMQEMYNSIRDASAASKRAKEVLDFAQELSNKANNLLSSVDRVIQTIQAGEQTRLKVVQGMTESAAKQQEMMLQGQASLDKTLTRVGELMEKIAKVYEQQMQTSGQTMMFAKQIAEAVVQQDSPEPTPAPKKPKSRSR